jgi:YaiO family outer membrane protein
VQRLLGRAYASSGREARSLSYLNRAIALDPSDETRRTLERARSAYDHRLEVTALSEQFDDGVADTQGADAVVNVRLSDVFRLSGRGQWERKFGRRDERAGVGLEWRVRPMTSLFGQALFGPDNEVLPQNEWYVAIDHASGPADWGFGYRFLDFLGARASVFGPTVLWQATDRVALDARYALVVSELSTLVDATTEQAALLRVSYLLRPRVTVMGGYARGIENFDAVSIDRLGEFGANTVSAGLRIDFPTLTSLLGSYEFQRRPDDISMQRFTVTFNQRF